MPEGHDYMIKLMKRTLGLCMQGGGTMVLLLGILALAVSAAQQDGGKQAKVPDEPAAKAKVGLSVNDARACQGYTLLAPMQSTKTYLIDNQGRVVRTWESDCTP